VDADSAIDERHKSGRRSRVVLSSSNFFARERTHKTNRSQRLGRDAGQKKKARPQAPIGPSFIPNMSKVDKELLYLRNRQKLHRMRGDGSYSEQRG
jgi:hypothetical protein